MLAGLLLGSNLSPAVAGLHPSPGRVQYIGPYCFAGSVCINGCGVESDCGGPVPNYNTHSPLLREYMHFLERNDTLFAVKLGRFCISLEGG